MRRRLLQLLIRVTLFALIAIQYSHFTSISLNHNPIIGLSNNDVPNYVEPLYQSTNQKDRGENICILIRTYIGHGLALPRQIIGWATIAETVLNESTSQIKHMSIYTINTHHVQNRSDDEAIVNTIHQTTTLFDEKNLPMDIHFIPMPVDLVPDKGKYGYDATNYLLNLTLWQPRKKECDRYIITNGDNTYHKDLLYALNTQIQQKDFDMIAFDFTSHHKGPSNGWIPNTKVAVEFKHGLIDLGAVVTKRRVLSDLCAKDEFTPLLFHTSYIHRWFAADWSFFEDAIRCKATTHVIPQVLLQHQ